ncbi:serine/threonine protein phosphatase PrpC [Pseudoduganella flava]|uniref:Serine/threonine protein phosphatase PrpC n=1 Tax=Pseudoduganella flava TaxID=871742 RepID=A0A562PTP7_9BURK|nr:serine/threonine-protein phosphatase [Pseudoduganella flava]QGZ38967.1 serine/threonine-protein phosphatase [Pseudoduganella flava]TWI47769.1 serine/threonine protein phosphatase PrpC [Pseudoduganella flava]
MSGYKIEAGTAQHIGDRPRQNDRAALFTAPKAPGYVLAVAADGGPANALGAEQLLHTSKQLFDEYKVGDTPSVERLGQLLREIAQETHDVLRMNPLSADRGAQSTMALLVLTPARQAVWATVGDTRLYRFTNGACTGKTGDAEYIDHLITVDKLPPDAARKHRSSRLLNNVLGNPLKPPFVAVGAQQDLRAGDGFLLCTDGLWPWLADNELAAVVARRTPREAADLLIGKARERAQQRGDAGWDNCTLAMLRLVAPAA